MSYQLSLMYDYALCLALAGMKPIVLQLVCCYEFVKESNVVFAEESEVLDEILQVGYSFNTHAERIAGVDFRIYTACFENIWVNHTATEDLDPSGAFAHSATFASANAATYVHLCTWLCEWEITGT